MVRGYECVYVAWNAFGNGTRNVHGAFAGFSGIPPTPKLSTPPYVSRVTFGGSMATLTTTRHTI